MKKKNGTACAVLFHHLMSVKFVLQIKIAKPIAHPLQDK